MSALSLRMPLGKCDRVVSFSARLLSLLQSIACIGLLAGCAPTDREGAPRTDIRWGTSAVGSSGHRALVGMAAVLNRELEDLSITVLPMPGAIMGMRHYAMGDLDAYYGADIAFAELATDSGRFAGFTPRMKRAPIQSFWAYTMEMGIAIDAANQDTIRNWSDLSGRPVFTGPRPWDTRAHLERVFSALGIEHRYVELDLGMAAPQLRSGTVEALGIYTTGERDVAPWVAEAELAADLVVLNPTPAEQETLRTAGFDLVTVTPRAFQEKSGVNEIVLSPFYYGFHLGSDYSEEVVYQILMLIEQHAAELARADAVFSQLVSDMPELQRRGVSSAQAHAEIHPGLARYMRERGVWNEAWNGRIATLD